MKQEVFTIDIYDKTNDNPLDDMSYSSDYDNEEEAIDAAREAALEYRDDDSVIIVTVYGGEYKTNRGIFGEPYDIYSVSNKDIETTKKTLESNGYSIPYADEYVYPACIFKDGTIRIKPFLYKRPA